MICSPALAFCRHTVSSVTLQQVLKGPIWRRKKKTSKGLKHTIYSYMGIIHTFIACKNVKQAVKQSFPGRFEQNKKHQGTEGQLLFLLHQR